MLYSFYLFLFKPIEKQHDIQQSLPVEPVNQYVNSWGNPYVYSYGNPYGYPDMNAWNRMAPIAYAPVQTEYGILVPENTPTPFDNGQHMRANFAPISYVPVQETPEPSSSADTISAISSLFPRSFIIVLAKWSSFISNFLSLFAFFSALTTALCTVTPLCTFNYAAAFKNLFFGENNNEIREKIEIAEQQLHEALNKFNETQIVNEETKPIEQQIL